MNTIPTTFDEHQIKRTVVGGIRNTSENSLNISVVLLNSRGTQFKQQVFENLLQCNFESIVSIENDAKNFSIDDMASKFPEIKFIVPLEKTSDGELINIAMSEVQSDYVLILRDSLYIPSGIILPHLAESLTKENTFCVVPRLVDSNKAGLPCRFSPTAEKSRFVIESSTLIEDGARTIYPFDNIAIYNRKKFIQLGGFDWTIKSNYWQNLDFAIRSWLWGEETKLTSVLQFAYAQDYPIQDTTINLDYLRYYLKNELPKLKMEVGIIKPSSFFVFFARSSCGYLEARRQFKAAKIWVQKNKYKFKMDLQSFVENWNK